MTVLRRSWKAACERWLEIALVTPLIFLLGCCCPLTWFMTPWTVRAEESREPVEVIRPTRSQSPTFETTERLDAETRTPAR